jgi:hypothetical protein
VAFIAPKSYRHHASSISGALIPAIVVVVENITNAERPQGDVAPYLSAPRPNVERERLASPSSVIWLRESPSGPIARLLLSLNAGRLRKPARR